MSETPWQRAKKTKSQKHEERFARLPGSKKQLNSGRHWFSKRDNIHRDFLVENRITDKGSYSINREEFIKITEDAIQSPPGYLPALQPTIKGLDLIVIRLEDFLSMSQEIAALRAIVNREDDE